MPPSARWTVVIYLRKTIPVKPIAAEAKRPNQLKIKWDLDGTTINYDFEKAVRTESPTPGRPNE